MNQFKKFNSQEEIRDVYKYIQDWIASNPNGEVVVGTDSAQLKKFVKYAIVIALYYEGHKGAHLIYSTIKEPCKVKLPLFTRLWNEVMYTYDTLEDILKNINIIGIPHIDINVDEEAGSNIAYQSAIGFFNSQGYDVVGKPYAWVATCAADCRCK